MSRIGRKELLDLFERFDDAMQDAQRLCLIGAAAVLAHGSNERQTEDIDIWRPASLLNDRTLGQAAKALGIGYNPTSMETAGIYLQIVQPGIVQLPAFDGERWATGDLPEILWQGRNLTVTTPPPAIIIAAKLARAEDRDIDDSVFLAAAKSVTTSAIRNAIANIADKEIRDDAMENMVLFELVLARNKSAQKRQSSRMPKPDEDTER